MSFGINYQPQKIIVPQLGAVGVSAYKVKQMTGFDVVFGPVRADDIGRFLENDFSATSEMRQVSFNFIDRAILAPLSSSSRSNTLQWSSLWSS